MKKYLLLILVVLLLFFSVACRNNTPAPQQPDIEEDIQYTDEFPYLPKHDKMNLIEFKEAPEGELNEGRYSIQDSEFSIFLMEYQDILVRNGWEVVEDNKPSVLSVKKENYQAVLILQSSSNELVLTILS